MAPIIEKIFTENPFVDELLYYTKMLAMGSILKNETEALKYETVESLKASDLYLSAIEGGAPFELFEYTKEILAKSSINPLMIPGCVEDNKRIPQEYREELRQLVMKDIIDNYVELNEYYRRVIGIPPKGVDGIKITQSDLPDGIIIDTNLCLHEMDNYDIKVLNDYGIIEKIKIAHPEATYLKYIVADINVYTARKGVPFQLLYLPLISSIEIYNKFKIKFEQNRLFTLKTVYSEAFKYGSEYYDNFIMVFMIIQTMLDILAEVQENIARRDVFDSRCIKYIFDSYGVPYYSEIPIKYQIAMMKNLNSLLKYKSTSKCMVEIASLFGFNNIQIFKYYLLRDRTIDIDGEYEFSTTEKNILQNWKELTIENKIIPVVTGQDIIIPFPFPEYILKGNLLIVKMKNHIVDEVDYIIDDTLLVFNNPNDLNGVTQIEFEFLYNAETINIDLITKDHEIYTKVYNVLATSDNQLEYEIPIPYNEHTKNGGRFSVIIGSTFISDDRYNIVDNKIIFYNIEDWMVTGRNVIFVFTYSDHMLLKNKSVKIISTANQSVFDIPEPFYNYCNAGNTFFITLGSTYIDETRYAINGSKLEFLDNFTVDENRTITFNFIYDDFKNINTVQTEIDTIVTTLWQSTFIIPFPFDDYISKNNMVFIKLNGKYLEEKDYNIFQDELVLDNVYTNVWDKITFVFIYTDTVNAITESKYLTIKTNDQNDFTIPFPFKYFLERGDKMLISLNGIVIDSTMYKITNSILRITNKNIKILKGKDLIFTFMYDVSNKRNIKTLQKRVFSTKEQSKFTIPFPFHGYMNSKNGLMVIVGGLFIDPIRYTIKNGILIFNDGYTISKNREVLFVFTYHTLYEENDHCITKIVDTYDLADVNKDNTEITIPFPFDDYLEQGNFFMVTVSNIEIPDYEYDIIDNKLIFNNVTEILKLGNILRFTFIFIDTGIIQVLTEDYSKNYELKFVKVPLSDNVDNFIKQKVNHKNYESIISEDTIWVGDSTHDIVKTDILKSEFNYVISKYISIDDIYSLTELSFDIPYFFNMLYDDVTLEENLVLNVLSLHKSKLFKLNDLFCYMTALTYEYHGIADDITDTTSKALFIKGFNFRADFGDLAQYMLENRVTLTHEDLGIADWQCPTTPILSFNSLLDIFTRNKAIYRHVIKQMTDAPNKRMYDIYKKIYDSLMVEKLNFEFFKTPSGSTAKSFTEFIQHRDTVLYSSIVRTRAIKDLELKQSTIISILTEVVYEIERYIDSDKYKYLFFNLPGISSDFVKKYIIKMIDFFKSYKVRLLDSVTIYKFDDKGQNSIKPIDQMYYKSIFDKDQISYVLESMDIANNITPVDKYRILEKIDIKYTY